MSINSCADNVWNIVADQGATFDRTLTLKDGARRVVPLPGYTARMHVRTKTEASTTVFMLTTENQTISINATAGEVRVRILPTATAAAPAGVYVYDLELAETSTGIVTRVAYGTFTLRAEVTR